MACTTRKVAMADEVEVAPWLLVYHGRRFWVPPWCMSKLFFSRFWGHLARRKRPKRRVWWPGTWCISKSRVRRPSQRKSAPPRDVGPRWQPLWHCFFSRSRHLVQRSPIEPFTMQDHGSRMSSSMNQNSFYSWIFLTPWFLATSFFFWSLAALETLRPLLLNGTRMSSSMCNQLSFLGVFFGTSNLVTCLFLSIPCRLSNGDTAAAKWDPHVILYVL